MTRIYIIVKCFICLGIVAITLLPTSAIAQSDVNKNNALIVKNEIPLFELVDTFSDFGTFRKTSSTLDALISKYCIKTKDIKDEYEVVFYYKCEPSTGIKSVKLDSRERIGESNWLMYLTINFNYENYSAIKKIVTKNLGPASKSLKDYVTWKYRTDKKLNELGNPIISISGDQSNHRASFDVVLEQGP